MRLQSGSASNSVPYTLWIHYEDVELYGNMVPQMGGLTQRKGAAGILNKAKDVLGMEIYAPGPIETIANKVKVVTDEIGKVPLLSSIAAPLSWMLDVISGTASAFGWSKPISLDPVKNCHLEMFNSMPNVDVHDQSVMMSMTAGNRIDPLPGFAGTDQDELSIDFLKNIFAFWDVKKWEPSHIVGTLLARIDLSPGYVQMPRTDGNINYVSMSPIAYLSHRFTYYRGGLRFKLFGKN